MLFDEKINISYLRLSKEDGDIESGSIAESCSISSQRKCIQNYLEQNCLKPDSFEEIIDDGYSGTNMDRPGMNRLIRLVAAGKVRCVIVRDLSRFARNYLEAGHYLEFVFPVHNVRFISINDQYDSFDYKDTTGGFEIAIKNLMNQMYSKDLSRKIKTVVDAKKLNGEFVYGTAPSGYKKGKKKNSIEVDDAVAQIVRNIFTWAASGVTITQIANRLNKDGVVTPSVYLAPVRGKYKTREFWTFESIRNILANRIYTGDTVPFKSHVVSVGSNRVKQIPEDEQIVIPCTHEAIISRELFYQARTVIKSSPKRGHKDSQYLFTSVLTCSCCGNKLSKGKAQNKYWRCSSHRYTDTTECSEVKIKESVLEGILINAINTQCKLLDLKITKIKKTSHLMKSSEQIAKEEVTALRKEISALEESKLELYESCIDGKLSRDEYLQLKDAMLQRIEKMRLELKVAENKFEKIQEDLRLCMSQVNESSSVTIYSEIKRLTPELVKELVKNIIVKPDGSIRIEWNYSNQIQLLVGDSSEIIGIAV